MEYSNVSRMDFKSMMSYLYMYLFPIALTILPIKFNRKTNSNLLTFYAIACTLFIGLRFQVGGDWGVYINNFISANASDYASMMKLTDPGYKTLLIMSANLGLSNLGVNLFAACFFMFGVHKLCKSQPYPWLGYIISFPYLICVVGMGYTRQSIVIGIILLIIWWATIGESKKNPHGPSIKLKK